jgi:hypothetical protein
VPLCCGELYFVNLFAFRATQPTDIGSTLDPVGPENRAWIERAVRLATDGLVVCVWCAYGNHMHQDEAVLGWIGGLCQPM